MSGCTETSPRPVTTHVSKEKIERFIRKQPFLCTVERHVRSAIEIDPDSAQNKLKEMDDDVATMKAMFRKLIGTTWAHASRANTNSKLFTGAHARASKPWEDYRKVAQKTGDDSQSAYVKRHLMTYCFGQEWQP